MKIQILPSLLAADMGNLEAGAKLAQSSGADALHVDIMDGHFVPNLSMGPAVVAMARRAVTIPLNVHLMMSRPDQYVEVFIKAGSDSLQIHVEADCDVAAALSAIRKLGARPGITLNPETPADTAFPFLSEVDEVLCMTVRPGYGGQSFMPEVLPKIRAIREQLSTIGQGDVDIMVDGGVDRNTIADCAAHGANMFVAGTALYAASDMAEEITVVRQNATAALKP